MKTWKIIIIIAGAIFIVMIGSGLYLVRQFFSALALPEIEITKEYISTNQNFVNGVTIEKIRVDSIGEKGYPVKYTTIYTTSCNIHNSSVKSQGPVSKIEFNQQGKCIWKEDTVKVDHIHKGLSRQSVSSSEELWWLNRYGNHSVCPLTFEPEQWYYFILDDRRITGIFFYIDQIGKEHTYFLTSGVSPI